MSVAKLDHLRRSTLRSQAPDSLGKTLELTFLNLFTVGIVLNVIVGSKPTMVKVLNLVGTRVDVMCWFLSERPLYL